MKYLLNNSTDSHWNMAFDECCLKAAPSDAPFFYLWQNKPSVIVGLNQNVWAEVNVPFLEQNDIVLARRVTGGGAVYHDLGNLNYTIVGRPSELEDGYLDMVASALRDLGVPAQRGGRNDIFVDDKKVSGWAKRLEKDRVMVHGTLMYDVDLETLSGALSVPGSKIQASGVASVRSRVANLKDYLPQFSDIKEFAAALSQRLSQGDGMIALDEKFLSMVDDLAASQFSTWDWNYGRSPKMNSSSTVKTKCGTVSLVYKVADGRIVETEFGGDFIGSKPVSELSDILRGCLYDPKSVEALVFDKIDDFFDGFTSKDLLYLLDLAR